MNFGWSLIITGPPKALDEDETEFLDNYESVSFWFYFYSIFMAWTWNWKYKLWNLIWLDISFSSTVVQTDIVYFSKTIWSTLTIWEQNNAWRNCWCKVYERACSFFFLTYFFFFVFYPPVRQKGNMNKNWQMRKPNNYVAFKLSHNKYYMITTLLFYIQIYKFIPCTFSFRIIMDLARLSYHVSIICPMIFVWLFLYFFCMLISGSNSNAVQHCAWT